MPRIIKEPLKTESLNSSQVDLTDMSGEELISIEDTYRETASACRKSLEESEAVPVVARGNKSMTIIEEEEYEESEIMG